MDELLPPYLRGSIDLIMPERTLEMVNLVADSEVYSLTDFAEFSHLIWVAPLSIDETNHVLIPINSSTLWHYLTAVKAKRILVNRTDLVCSDRKRIACFLQIDKDVI